MRVISFDCDEMGAWLARLPDHCESGTNLAALTVEINVSDSDDEYVGQRETVELYIAGKDELALPFDNDHRTEAKFSKNGEYHNYVPDPEAIGFTVEDIKHLLLRIASEVYGENVEKTEKPIFEKPLYEYESDFLERFNRAIERIRCFAEQGKPQTLKAVLAYGFNNVVFNGKIGYDVCDFAEEDLAKRVDTYTWDHDPDGYRIVYLKDADAGKKESDE